MRTITLEKIKAEPIKPTLEDRKELDKVFDKLIAEEKANIELTQEAKPAETVRFALTDDGTLMILGVHYLPIELSKADTKRLYEFAENTVHAI